MLYLAQRDLDRRIIRRPDVSDKAGRNGKVAAGIRGRVSQSGGTGRPPYRLGAVPIATYVELQKQYLEAVEALPTRARALEALEL